VGQRQCDCCVDDLMSEAGVTDVLPITTTAIPSAAYRPPEPSLRAESMLGSHLEYCEANTAISSTADKAASHRRVSAASACSAATFQSTMSAVMPPASGGGDVQTLPRLELNEPVVVVDIIEVQLPWLFWVQRQSKKQVLEDILDRLE